MNELHIGPVPYPGYICENKTLYCLILLVGVMGLVYHSGETGRLHTIRRDSVCPLAVLIDWKLRQRAESKNPFGKIIEAIGWSIWNIPA